MITFAVQTFEYLRTWLVLFHFKPWWIGFEVSFAALSELSIMLSLMRTIALDTL